METWKITYYPKILNAGMRGVALIEAATQQDAIHTFNEQYAGEFSTIESVKKLLG